MAAVSRFIKDPQARLDYAVDWSAWLAAAETISAQTVTVTSGDVTLDGSPAQASGVVTQWLTAGTLDTTSRVRFHITTSAGRQDDRSLTIDVRDR